MLALTWNLFHGRAVPSAGHELIERFAASIASWEWDVALLQEVPPWWAQPLAEAAGAEQRRVLTSRNSLLPLRRGVARRRPDLIKSNGGGSNVILVRSAIAEHRRLRLRVRPERRVAQLVRLAGGTCVANFHGSTRVALAEEELAWLCREALAFAGSSPLILGGDLNLRRPAAPDPQLALLGSRDVDHLFARGMERVGEPALLDRGVVLGRGAVELSDHPPLRIELRTRETAAPRDGA